jgi:hypothetical protein
MRVFDEAALPRFACPAMASDYQVGYLVVRHYQLGYQAARHDY